MIEQQTRRILDSAKTSAEVIHLLESSPSPEEVLLNITEHLVKDDWMSKCSKVLCYMFPQTSTRLLSSSQMIQYMGQRGIRLQGKILQLLCKQNMDSTSVGNLYTVLIQLMKVFPERVSNEIKADPSKFQQSVLSKIGLVPTPDFVVSLLNLNRAELHSVKVSFLNHLLSFLETNTFQNPKLALHLLQQLVQDVKAAEAEARLSPYQEVLLKSDLWKKGWKDERVSLGVLELVLATAVKSQVLEYAGSKHFLDKILNNEFAIESSLRALVCLFPFLKLSEKQDSLLWAFRASLHSHSAKLHLYAQRLFLAVKEGEALQTGVFEQAIKKGLGSGVSGSLRGLILIVYKKIGIKSQWLKQIVQVSHCRESRLQKSENFGKMQRVRGRGLGE